MDVRVARGRVAATGTSRTTRMTTTRALQMWRRTWRRRRR
jgi:hypothetical protein